MSRNNNNRGSSSHRNVNESNNNQRSIDADDSDSSSSSNPPSSHQPPHRVVISPPPPPNNNHSSSPSLHSVNPTERLRTESSASMNHLNPLSSTPIPPSPQLRIQRSALNLAEFNSKFVSDPCPECISVGGGGNGTCSFDPSAGENNYKLGPSYRLPHPDPSTLSLERRRKGNVKSVLHEKSKEKINEGRRVLSSRSFWIKKIHQFFPFTDWLLRRYDWKNDLVADILVGITVAIFQVPQSMGYCLIARVPPVHGLYTAFFPALIYTFLGTSRHAAIGAFALVSGVMTGHLVLEVHQEIVNELPYNQRNLSDEYVDELHVQIATAASLCIGIYMTMCGLLQLGFISIYLSPQSISGFCCAASIYVFTSQLSHLTGAKLPPRSGFLAMPLAYYDLVVHGDEIHPLTISISIVFITILAFFKVYLNDKFIAWQNNLVKERNARLSQQAGERRAEDTESTTVTSPRCTWNALPFPIELVVVVVMTAVSRGIDLESKDVEIVGPIKQGMPMFIPPPLGMLRRVYLRSIPLGIVGYAISLSIGRLFGGKHGYTVDPNQELTALGTCNLISSCFGCLPCAASLPRSAIQEGSGGRTQMVSLVNCAALLFVIMAIGSLLESLPNCILASIIAVALIGLIKQGEDLIRLWKFSVLDGLQWLVSFLAVFLLDVDVGLYVGTGFSLLVLIYKSSRPKTYLLGSCSTAAEDIYVPVKIYGDSTKYQSINATSSSTTHVVSEKEGVKVYQFCGPLHFSSKDFFKRDIVKSTGVGKVSHPQTTSSPSHSTPVVRHVVIDCSMFAYVDSSGIDAMKSVLREELAGRGVSASLASCPPHVVTLLARDRDFFSDYLSPEEVFVSVHDAVLHALEKEKLRGSGSSDGDR